MMSWIGPLIGAILLGTCSSWCSDGVLGWNLLIVGGAAGALRHARPERHHGWSTPGGAERSPMSGALLEVRGVTNEIWRFYALDGVDFMVRPGERVGPVGPTARERARSSLHHRELRKEEGSIRFDGEDIGGHAAHKRIRLGLARSFQIPKPFASMSRARQPVRAAPLCRAQHEKLPQRRIVEERCASSGRWASPDASRDVGRLDPAWT